MVETLVQRIRRIDTQDNPNRDEEIKTIFERHALSNSATRIVITSKGQSTYHQQYENVLGSFDGLASLRPFLLPDNFEASVADLQGAIGNPKELRGSLYTALENPTGMAGSLGLILAGISFFKETPNVGERKVSRREFVTAGFLLGAAVGVVGGGTLSVARNQTLSSLEQNARYLDQFYSRVYKQM